MDYNKPSRLKANEEFMRANGIVVGNPYQENFKEQIKTFLIICEGKNTELGYFRGFPVPSKSVILKGGCNSKNSLVDYALELKNKIEFEGREIWCVFDYDVKPDEVATQLKDFNSAIEKADNNGMKVAWSNDAFELWFVLHYQKLDTPLTRHELYQILKEKWKLKSFSNEAKKDEFCKAHYERHNGINGSLQTLAIKRAKELHQIYNGDKNFAKHCPCTTVYLLVEELNKYTK